MKTTFINKTAFRKIDKFEPEWLYNLRKDAWDFYHDSDMPERTTNVALYRSGGVRDEQYRGIGENITAATR